MARKNKSNINQRIRELKDKAVDTADRAQTMVKKNPWQSVAVAAAVGAIIGLAAGVMIRRDHSPRLVRKLRDYLE